jgi:hypothetical protein
MNDEELQRQWWKADLLLRANHLYRRGIRNVTFSVYRRGDISATHTENQRAAPDEIQFDGVIFHDGTTVIHWDTAVHSTAVFESFDELLEIHGHPEYDTEFRFVEE